MDRADAVTSRRQAPRNRLQAPGPELRPTAPTTGTVACPRCKRRFVAERYAADLNVCSECGHHGVVGAAQRIDQLADPDTAETLAIDVGDRDPLGFADRFPYPQRVARARERTGLHEAFLTARASLAGNPVVLACMDFEFLGGSLGSGAGEIFARACELAVAEQRALVAVCTSGGARMQEGIASLAQMGRCAPSLRQHPGCPLLRRRHRLVRGPVGRDHRRAGSPDRVRRRQGDRAGDPRQAPRRLPDRRVPARAWDGRRGGRAPPPPRHGRNADPHLLGARVTTSIETTERERIAFAAVELARHPERPRALQVIAAITGGWTELRGDRLFGDDRAVVGGPARLGGRSVMVIGQEKGTDPLTRALHNFGMPHPEGYRKAVRLMRQAEKFSMPVVCLVDTPAAHAGVAADEHGQAWESADALLCLLGFPLQTALQQLTD